MNVISRRMGWLSLLTMTCGLCCLVIADEEPPWPGVKGDFHGFVHHAFELDGVKCRVVLPKKVATGKPWVWRARFFGHQPQVDLTLLERGYHIGYADVANLYGSPEAVKRWERFYEYVTRSHGWAARPALEGMSRGGLIVFNWAARHPDKVACIYADAPVCDIRSWPGGRGSGKGAPRDWVRCLASYGLTEESAGTFDKNPVDLLEPLAKAKIPLLHVVGDKDVVVPVSENTAVIEERYQAMGGTITVIHKPEVGHHPHCLEDPTPIVDFVIKHTGQ